MRIRASAYFALVGVAGVGTLYPVVVMMWSGLVPALLFIPLVFMVGGGMAGARLELGAMEVRSLAWAFALVGFGLLGADILAEWTELPTVLVVGAGSMLASFVAAGIAAALGGFEGCRRRVWVAFAVGGAVAALAFVALKLLLHVQLFLYAAGGVVAGLAATGALVSECLARAHGGTTNVAAPPA